MSLSRRLPPLVALLFLTACAAQHAPASTSDRVVAVLADGTVWRQTTADESSAFTVTAPADAVWVALTNSYTALGIAPTISDRASGTYGNAGFAMPRVLADHRIDEYFDCGQGLSGPRVSGGRVTATAVSTIAPADGGTMRVQTRITGVLRSNDGASNDPITCSSTGRLEATLRAGVEQRLAAGR
jgi:hypothetical protein